MSTKSIPKVKLNEPEHGSTMILFIGDFNPPTMDHFRVIEALLKRPDIKGIWLCPLYVSENEHVKAMVNMLALDFSIQGKQVVSCSVALNLGIKDAKGVLEKIRTLYPFFNFQLATIAPLSVLDYRHTFFVKIGSAHVTEPQGTIGINLQQVLPVPDDVLVRLKNSEDVSRHFPKSIWMYLQKHKLYR
jgi:hypothetical protein